MLINLKIIVLCIAIASIAVVFLSSGMDDVDADGISDKDDNCLDVPNPKQLNFDFDDFGDKCDIDDDNDGIIDNLDMFDDNPSEWSDFDFDGLGNNTDTDDDNDGIIDIEDSDPILITEEWTIENLDTIQNCAKMDDGTARLLCYGKFFDGLIQIKKDNKNAIQLAFELSKIGALDDCHFVSHTVGHSSFEKNPSVVDNLRGMDSSLCRGGFYHGVMSAYFHDVKENHQELPDFKNICNEFIGLPDYQDCVHGLGHGFVHYYTDDMQPVIEACHEMSFYQGSLCIGGAMMQYTDGELTRYSDWNGMIPDVCSKLNLSEIDYHQCNVSLGLSLAYHTDHNADAGSKFCNLIKDKKGKDVCLTGLLEEIDNAKTSKVNPLTNDIREKFQPQLIDDSIKIDIRTQSTVSNFDYVPEIKLMTFSFDKPQYIILYVPEKLLPSQFVVLVNGVIPNNLIVDDNFMGEDVTMIQFVPRESGMVMIAPA